MTYEEAVKLVDAGGRIARESHWTMTKAGFAWGPWVERKRIFTQEDIERYESTPWDPENPPPPLEATGRWYRAYCTLCESVEVGLGEAVPGDDWVDVTDRFEEGGVPKGHGAYFGRDSEC